MSKFNEYLEAVKTKSAAMISAVKAISSELKDNPETDKNKLIDKVSQEFNLSPRQQEFLIEKYIRQE